MQHTYWNGHSEEIYGKVLPAVRKSVFITTKSTARTRREAEAELHLSLELLQTDYVDLWQVHAIQEKEEVEQILGPGGAIEAFVAAKKAGKCRFIGFTGHHDPQVHLKMLRSYDQFDTILMPLNIADPSYLSFEKLVLPVAIEQNLGIQGMKNFANSKLLQFLQCPAMSQLCPESSHSLHRRRKYHFRATGRRRARGPEFQGHTMMSKWAALRQRAIKIKGPRLEDWKRDVEATASVGSRRPYRDGFAGDAWIPHPCI